jgi:hypothetical protein
VRQQALECRLSEPGIGGKGMFRIRSGPRPSQIQASQVVAINQPIVAV